MSYQSSTNLVNKRSQVFKKEYRAWGRVFHGYIVRLSDVQKHLGLFKDLDPVAGYMCWIMPDHITVFSREDPEVEYKNITPKQFRTIKKYKLKTYTMID